MDYPFDFSDVRGQQAAIRAVERAVIERRVLLLVGPPGCGKFMIARRVVTILPELTLRETWETAGIYGAARSPFYVPALRPFCAPHHSCSMAGMLGGGLLPHVHPGQISLAHNGVLLLDEAAKFRRSVLTELVDTYTTGIAVLRRRDGGAIYYPSRPRVLVLTTQPCPCGARGAKDGIALYCRCSSADIARYNGRLDVFKPLNPLRIEVPEVPYRKLITGKPNESSASIRARVILETS